VRVVVTGGAGFIGSHIVDALVAAGHETIVVDDLSTGARSQLAAGVELHEVDIQSPAATGAVVDLKPDAICHQAAQISVSASQRDAHRDMDVNIGGTLRMLEAARSTGARFVCASSAAVYGLPRELPVAEEHPTQPISNYGVSKLAVEHYVRVYGVNSGLSYAVLRYANVYGPRQNTAGEAGVVALFCEAMLRGEAASIHGDGRQTRDFVFVTDVARANLAALTATASGVFNVGTGTETDVNTLERLLADHFESAAAALHTAPRPADITRSVLAVDRIREQLGWTATVGREAGLAETALWFAERGREARPRS
jgi:UDP-glucose 4-epimerase